SAAFNTDATDLVSNDSNNFCDTLPYDAEVRNDQSCSDVFVHHADPADPLSADRTGDKDLNDTILEGTDASTGLVSELCPATTASVLDGAAVFLRPEKAGSAPLLPTCPFGALQSDQSVDLNDDGDGRDEVVHLWRGSGSVENLHCAARSVALSHSYVAAL